MSPLARRAVSAGLVVLAALGSYAAARRTRAPFSAAAPAFRRDGPEDAKVKIVEFSDFECPACRAADRPLRGIQEAYKGKLLFVFKHFPLRMHRHARAGATAAECAGRQGRFWEYHHVLYDRQPEWSDEDDAQGPEAKLERYARELKLDVPAWQACRKDPATEAAIAADMKDGENAWVGATPTFFIDGRRFVGSMDLTQRGVPYIDKELAK